MEVDQYIPTIAIASIAVIVLILWRKFSNLPPGPWGLPVLGYFPFLNITHEDFFKLSKKYGDVFSFRTIGGQLVVVLNGAKAIKDVLVNRFEEFDRRPTKSNFVSWVSEGYGIAQEDGPGWSDHRKFFLSKARELGMGKLELEEVIHDEVRSMIQELHKNGKDTRYSIAYAMSSVISHVLFKRKIERGDLFRQLLKSLDEMVQTFMGTTHFLIGWPYDLMDRFSPSMRRMKRGRDQVRQFSNNIVKELKVSLDSDHANGYVHHYLQNQKELQTKSSVGTFTNLRLDANAFNLFFEGTESVSSAILMMLCELAKHPDVQRAVQKELDNVVGSERLPSWGDRINLPYLDATVQELYRVAPPFAISTLYCNKKETTINGYKIPENTILVANYHSIHFDSQNFPNPEKFDPERFLSNGKRIKQEGPYPFGIGKRSCIGEALAQVEVFIVIASILQHFNLIPGENLVVEPRKK